MLVIIIFTFVLIHFVDTIIVQSPLGADVHVNGNLIASCGEISNIFSPPKVISANESDTFKSRKIFDSGFKFWDFVAGSKDPNDIAVCPNAGISHFASSIFQDHAYMFGGRGGIESFPQIGAMNTLWRYSFDLKLYFLVSGDNNILNTLHELSPGNEYVYDPLNNPPGLMYVKGVQVNNEWFIVGGSNDVGQANDIWVTDYDEWKLLKGNLILNEATVIGQGASDTIGGIEKHSVLYISSKVVVFGGNMYHSNSVLGYSNSVFHYDITSSTWSFVKGNQVPNGQGNDYTSSFHSNNQIGARMDFSFWFDGTRRFHVFGGMGVDTLGNVGVLNDLWVFDNSATLWKFISGVNNAVDTSMVYGDPYVYNGNSMIGGLFGMAHAKFTPDDIIVIGGVDGSGNSHDAVWTYSLTYNEWAFHRGLNYSQSAVFPSEKECGKYINIPSAEGASALMYNEKLYFIGGLLKSPLGDIYNERYCDIWTISDNCETVIATAYPGEVVFEYTHSNPKIDEENYYKVVFLIQLNVIDESEVHLRMKKNGGYVFETYQMVKVVPIDYWYSYQAETYLKLKNDDEIIVEVSVQGDTGVFFPIHKDNEMTLFKMD